MTPDPASGLSRGTIVADTTCELFLVHKSQMQTFVIESPMLEKVKQKAVQYPDDTGKSLPDLFHTFDGGLMLLFICPFTYLLLYIYFKYYLPSLAL